MGTNLHDLYDFQYFKNIQGLKVLKYEFGIEES